VTDHSRFMELAYQEALRARDEGEVPVGAVIVRDGRIVGRGYNRIEALSDATAHAEIIAISAASGTTASWRLNGCTLYVTLEPCLMCLGAIMHSRIEAIVFGAADPRYGAVVSHPCRQPIEDAYRWFPAITAEVLSDDCSQLLKGFFSDLRKKDSSSRPGIR